MTRRDRKRDRDTTVLHRAGLTTDWNIEPIAVQGASAGALQLLMTRPHGQLPPITPRASKPCANRKYRRVTQVEFQVKWIICVFY